MTAALRGGPQFGAVSTAYRHPATTKTRSDRVQSSRIALSEKPSVWARAGRRNPRNRVFRVVPIQ